MSVDATFIHESGHVVATRALRGRTHTVVVFGEGDAETSSLFVRNTAPEDLAVYVLAGRAAQLAAGYPIDRRDSHDDQRRALAIARDAAWPSLLTLDAEAAALLDRAEKRAERLVRANLREIRHFAGALRAAGGRLAGREVAAALLDAFGGSWQDDIPRPNRSVLIGQAVAMVSGSRPGGRARREASSPASRPSAALWPSRRSDR